VNLMSNECLVDVDARLAIPLPIASPSSVGFSAERLNRMDSAMQAEIDAGHYAGISVMVARHGKLAKFRRYGYQALGSSEPLREDATFRIASMTKPIIAVAMLLLYEEGKWQLDDPATKFIPEFADLQVLQDGKLVPLDRTMTMRDLMASCAGFAFGPAFGSTNPKVDEMYAKADLWSGTNDDIIPNWPSSLWKRSPAPNSVTVFSRRFRAQFSGASPASNSIPSSNGASSRNWA
jgi:CubicO group peptidase (beta-lactamase class C family)